MKFDDILEALESDVKILDFKFEKNQFPMYLMIRYYMIQFIINKQFNLSDPHVRKDHRSVKKIFIYIYQTIKNNIYLAPKKNIYIFSSGIVNKLENKNYTNRLYDNFFQLFREHTQIIETSTKLSYMLPKKEKIYFRDLFDIIATLLSYIIRPSSRDIREINSFIKFINNKNIHPLHDIMHGDIKSMLLKASVRLIVLKWLYGQFLKIKKPKLIIVEDAHYFENHNLLQEAKKLGIKTAEYQHGYIGLAHPAYNYHKNIVDLIKIYLPDYLLTHGRHWSKATRTPSKKIQIGYADLSNSINQQTTIKNKSKKILFISGGTVHEKLNQLIGNSFKLLKAMDYEVFIRPHPSETLDITERYANLLGQGVKLDISNLYDVLAEIDIVVGMEASTVLYEALCFTNKVYMANTKYTNFYEPMPAFICFVDYKELVRLIQEQKQIDCNIYDLWNENWKQNYIDFIINTIGLQV